MRLRFKVPVQLYLLGPSEASLHVCTEFSHKAIDCTLEISGDDPLSVETLPADSRVVQFGRNLQLTLRQTPASARLSQIIESDRRRDLAELLRLLANRCLRAIRNFGMVPQIHEFRPDEGDDHEAVLSRWQVEVAADDVTWHPMYPQPPGATLLAAILGNVRVQDPAELRTVNWPRIDEAIQEDLSPEPEQEFTTNALEHLRQRNYRLALVEAVVGLEIVLTRYVKEYLIHKGTPASRIKEFLTSRFDLSTRLAGLLDLTLSPGDLKEIDLERVRSAIRWRNKVVHAIGNLPAGIGEEQLLRGILSVLAATLFLAGQAQEMRAAPGLAEIADGLRKRHQIPVATIRLVGDHRIVVDCEFFRFGEQFPDVEKLEALASDVAGQLKVRDARLDPTLHLYVRFYEFPRRLRARWKRGSLEVLDS